MALGTFLDIEVDTVGIGFVNPYPLPSFPPNMQALHLLGRSAALSTYNRVTLEPADFQSEGVTFNDHEIRSATTSENWSLPVRAGDFTMALAVDLKSVVFPTRIVGSSDWSSGSRRGFRLTATSSSSADLSLQFEAHNAAGFAQVNRSFNLPTDGKTMLVFLGMDSTECFLSVPARSFHEVEAATGGDTEPHTAEARYVFPFVGGEDETNIGYSAYALWARSLSPAEIANAHTALIAWGAELGVEFA